MYSPFLQVKNLGRVLYLGSYKTEITVFLTRESREEVSTVSSFRFLAKFSSLWLLNLWFHCFADFQSELVFVPRCCLHSFSCFSCGPLQVLVGHVFSHVSNLLDFYCCIFLITARENCQLLRAHVFSQTEPTEIIRNILSLLRSIALITSPKVLLAI